jgi:hypothetical protein
MEGFIFIDKGPGKKITQKSHSFLSWNIKILMRTLQQTRKLVFQHKNSMYYSESKEKIMEEGTEKICHQKENWTFCKKQM